MSGCYGNGIWSHKLFEVKLFLPPQGSGPGGGTPNFPRVKKKYRMVVSLVCENFLDLMKLGALGGPG